MAFWSTTISWGTHPPSLGSSSFLHHAYHSFRIIQWDSCRRLCSCLWWAAAGEHWVEWCRSLRWNCNWWLLATLRDRYLLWCSTFELKIKCPSLVTCSESFEFVTQTEGFFNLEGSFHCLHIAIHHLILYRLKAPPPRVDLSLQRTFCTRWSRAVLWIGSRCPSK